jgi:uncharacterized protein YegP (UPF0339 family)
MEFRVYRDVKAEWRWRLYVGNHRVIADSGESYQHLQECVEAITLIRRDSVRAHVFDTTVSPPLLVGM